MKGGPLDGQVIEADIGSYTIWADAEQTHRYRFAHAILTEGESAWDCRDLAYSYVEPVA